MKYKRILLKLSGGALSGDKNFGFDKLFNDINLEIKTNERVALVGDNGCGKSTLLNIVAGELSLDSGEIAIRQNRKIGYLKQYYDNIDNNLGSS